MMTIDDISAHLQIIHDHDDNDLSPNDKAALLSAIKLCEREALVRQLLAMVDNLDETTGDGSGYVKDAAAELRDFKLNREDLTA